VRPAPLKQSARIALPWPDPVLSALAEANANLRGSGGLKLDIFRLVSSVAQSSAYDVLGVANPVQDGLTGLLAPLPDSIAASDYSLPLTDLYRRDGRLFALPLAVSIRSFVYRSDLFAQAGLDPAQPPAGWEELASAARLLTEVQEGEVVRAGLELSLSANTADWLHFGWQNGARVWTNQPGTPDFSSPEFVQSARFFRSFFRDPPGTFRRNPSLTDPTKSLFGAGLAAMAFRDFHELNSLSELPPDIFATVRLAPPPAAVTPVTPARGRMLLGIGADSRNFDAAAAAIDRLSQPAIARALTAAAGLAPARASLQIELEESDSRYRTYFQSLDFIRDWHAWPVPGVILDARRATPRLALSADPVEAILEDVSRQARDRVFNTAGAG
jgi:ABC-type glycerol-3-phosphate transport system substrate-binding protein